MQIKTTLLFHFSEVRMLRSKINKTKNQITTNIGMDVAKRKHLFTVDGVQTGAASKEIGSLKS